MGRALAMASDEADPETVLDALLDVSYSRKEDTSLVTRTWETRERPILEAIAAADERDEAIAHSSDLEALTGLPAHGVRAGLRALRQDSYIEAIDATSHHGFDYMEIRLTGDGRRAVGQWPPDDTYRAVLEQLDALIAASSDSGTRTKLESLRAAVVDVGIEAIGGIIASIVTR